MNNYFEFAKKLFACATRTESAVIELGSYAIVIKILMGMVKKMGCKKFAKFFYGAGAIGIAALVSSKIHEFYDKTDAMMIPSFNAIMDFFKNVFEAEKANKGVDPKRGEE